MERQEDDAGNGFQDGSRAQGKVPLAAASSEYRRPGKDDRSPEPMVSEDQATQGPSERRSPYPWMNWQAALYVFVLGLTCLVLAPLTSLWWIFPVLAAAVPLTLAVLQRPDLKLGRVGDKKYKERELLEALAERGELTPATAAMRTSLTVEEASKMLEELAGKGHLNLRAEDGIMFYVLAEWDRYPGQGMPHTFSEPGPECVGAPERLDDPLSERELEVLALLASGRTNAEIARHLFVALGTVKSHLNNIYRKLGAANRADAVTRARKTRLLP